MYVWNINIDVGKFFLLIGCISSVVSVVDNNNSMESNLNEINNVTTGIPIGRTFLLLHLLKQKLKNLYSINKVAVTTHFPFVGCVCIPYYFCNVNNTINTGSRSVIDLRYRHCTSNLEVCCFLQTNNLTVVPMIPLSVTTGLMNPTVATMVIQMIPMIQTATQKSSSMIAISPELPVTMPMMQQSPITNLTTKLPPVTIQFTIQPPLFTVLMTQQLPVAMQQLIIPTTQQSPLIVQMPPQFSPFVMPITQQTMITTPIINKILFTTSLLPFVIFNNQINVLPTNLSINFSICNNNSDSRNEWIRFLNTQQNKACVGIYTCCNYLPGTISSVGPTLIPIIISSTFPPFLLPNQLLTSLSNTGINSTASTPIIFGLNCVCIILSACVNGYINISNVYKIDPRFIIRRQMQSTMNCNSIDHICCTLSQTDSLNNQLNFNNLISNEIKNPGTINACRCILINQCPEGHAVTYDGNYAIDPRFGPCASATFVCCRIQNGQRSVITTPNAMNSLNIHSTTIINNHDLSCGVQDTSYASISKNVGETYFAEFPWMVLLIVRKLEIIDSFQCGGSLINNKIVLTAAHCIISCDPETIVARIGEWDIKNINEPLPYQEIPAKKISIHPYFVSGLLYHDIALVILAKSVQYTINIKPVCLPSNGLTFANNTICYATGWGRSSFDEKGQYQMILRKIDLPLVDNMSCETRLRKTRLGQSFQLHSSFICAGGEVSKDTCYKDGGGPLVCQDHFTSRFIQVGIISWGIGCGNSTPGVYSNVALYRQWIDQQILFNGI